MISQEEYKQISKQLNFDRRLIPSLPYFILDAILLILGISLIQSHSVILCILSQLVLAIVFLHAFLWVHECGHNSLSSNKKINALIGHIFGVFCFMPFYTWKFIHEEHHKWTGHIDNDPVFALLKDARQKKKLPWIFHFGWRTFIPLNMLFLHMVYWFYPLTLSKQNKLTKYIFKYTLFSTLTLIVSYGLIIWLLPKGIHLYAFFPAIVLYGLIWETLSTPQHLGLEPTTHKPRLKDHVETTRSTWFPFFLQRYLFLNFGYHIEHHLFPVLPWHELDKVHNLVKEKLGDNYNIVTGVKWNIKMRSENMETAIGVHNRND